MKLKLNRSLAKAFLGVVLCFIIFLSISYAFQSLSHLLGKFERADELSLAIFSGISLFGSLSLSFFLRDVPQTRVDTELPTQSLEINHLIGSFAEGLFNGFLKPKP